MPLFPDTNSGWSRGEDPFNVAASEVQMETLPEKEMVSVKTSSTALKGATALPVQALSSGLPSGTLILFQGQGVKTTAIATTGATSLTVEALRDPIQSGSIGTTQVTNDAPYAARSRSILFEGELSAPISYAATASAIQTALEDMDAFEPGDISVQGASPNFIYSFGGAYANRAVSQLKSIDANGEDLRFFEVVVNGASAGAMKSVRREITRNALTARGFGRGGLVANDVERLRQRKPKDIGEVGRDPFER